MSEFLLIYNPYFVEVSLQIKMYGKWLIVRDESGLMYIAKERMQRWLSRYSKPSFFDELRNVSGDDEVCITFSGTREDFEDLSEAAKEYNNSHKDADIIIKEDGNTSSNSCEEKFRELQNMLARAENSSFRFILPISFWNSAREILKPITDPIKIYDVTACKFNEIFAKSEWRMMILTFDFASMKSPETRHALSLFSQTLSEQPNCYREYERFLLLCRCAEEDRSNFVAAHAAVEKLLMEYGLHLLSFSLLTEKEFTELNKMKPNVSSEQFYAVRQIIWLYRERYAEQFRICHVRQALQAILRESGFGDKKQTLKTIEQLAGRDKPGKNNVSDQKIIEAREWVMKFQLQLDHLLDIHSSVQGVDNDEQ